MTNKDKIIIVARYEAFITETAKNLGVLSGNVREVVKEYEVLRKKYK